MKRLLFACTLLVLAGCDAPAQQRAPILPNGGYLVFAAGYGTSGSITNNYLLLGDYTFSTDGRVMATYDVYDANANTKPRQAEVAHAMQAPYGGTQCQNKLIDMPRPAVRRNYIGTWDFDGKILKVVIENNTYEWIVDAAVADAFRLSRIAPAAGPPDLPLVVGFAYASRNPRERATLSKANFLPYYDGNIYHKDNNALAATDWKSKPSGLKIGAFAERENGHVLSLANAGTAREDIWVQNSILLNADDDSGYVLYQDLGHDFNRNGCYDEYGHTKKLLATNSGAGRPIRNMVYVEYSYTFDGFPMLSVGRYYPKKQTGVASVKGR